MYHIFCAPFISGDTSPVGVSERKRISLLPILQLPRSYALEIVRFPRRGWEEYLRYCCGCLGHGLTGRTTTDGQPIVNTYEFLRFKYDIGTKILMSKYIDHGTAFTDTHSKIPTCPRN